MSILSKIHGVKLFRIIAKKIFSGFPIGQNFYGGKIYMDAVEHSWAWTGARSYETFDKELQDKLYELSLSATKFVDIGSNIGAITLGILIRNKKICVIAVEPNPFAIRYFKKSLLKNNLEKRCQIIEAVVSSNADEKSFDTSGSVLGHIVNDGGLKVKSLSFWDFIRTTAQNEKLLVKVDIEGFETDILKFIPEDIKEIKDLTLVFELHPKGLNNVGDPNFCVKQLLDSGLKVSNFYGQKVYTLKENEFSQNIVKT